MRAFGTTLVLTTLTLVGPASAQWVYQGNESAFGSDTMHVALTGSGDYGFGFRCKAGEIEAVYLTPDRSFDADAYKLANITEPKLRIRIDDRPVVDLEAELNDVSGKASVLAPVEKELLLSAKDARKRIAVVLELLGDNYHEQSFNVRGSTKAIGSVIAGCGLGPG